MTWLWEEPVYIAILGVVTVAFLVFGLMQTGYRRTVVRHPAAAALTPVLLLLEYLVETEPERIEATLRRWHRDVERNDHEAIYSYVYSGATGSAERASAEFPRYSFDERRHQTQRGDRPGRDACTRPGPTSRSTSAWT